MALSDEIMGGPVTVYIAPDGTVEPEVDDDEAALLAGDWLLLGAQGAKNITEDGVRMILEDEKNLWRGLGSTLPQRAFKNSEGGRFEFELADTRAEAVAMNRGGSAETTPDNVTVTAAGAGTPGKKTVELMQGFDLTYVALLVRRYDSPENPALNSQWWLPRVIQNSNPELVSVKGEPQVLAFSYEIMEHPTLGGGRYTVQTAAPSS